MYLHTYIHVFIHTQVRLLLPRNCDPIGVDGFDVDENLIPKYPVSAQYGYKTICGPFSGIPPVGGKKQCVETERVEKANFWSYGMGLIGAIVGQPLEFRVLKVCVHMCMHVCMYVCMYVSVRVWRSHAMSVESLYTYARISEFLCAYIYIHTYIHVRTCTDFGGLCAMGSTTSFSIIHTYIHTYMCIHT
jgi:hypothetical protein